MRRRELLMAVGTGTAAGVSGCLNGDNGDDGDGRERDFDLVDDEPDYQGYFDGTTPYDDVGGTVDWTGEEEVTVMAGTDDYVNKFYPAAVAVDSDTTVEWEWGTRGHNVVRATAARRTTANTRAEGVDTGGEDWEGDDRILNPPHTYEHTFTEPGIYLYVCVPHDAQRMYGAVVVRD